MQGKGMMDLPVPVTFVSLEQAAPLDDEDICFPPALL